VREYWEGDIEIAAMGRDDREYESKRRKFGRIDPFCLFAVVPMVAVGVALVFSDVPILAPVMFLLAGLVVLLDSWLHRPGRLIDPRAAKQALRRAKEAEKDGGSEVRRVSNSYDTDAQGRPRNRPAPGGRANQGGDGRQQPNRQRQPASYRNEPERGRSRY
jgi:hypothetical protein